MIDIDGVSLECVWLGPAPDAAPSLVLLHEGLGSIALWKDVPKQLAQRTGCGVLVYSREGYGASSPLRNARSPSYMHYEAETVLPALLDEFGIEQPPILIGHSDGASIALIYAGSGAPAPAGLVLEAPHVFVEDVTVAGIEAARHAYEATDLRRKLARYHSDVDEAFGGWNDIWLSPDFRDWNIEAYLPATACPILMIQGRDDQYATTAQLDAIARQTAGRVETAVLDDCGHSPHHEQREATLDLIVGFVKKTRPNQTANEGVGEMQA